MLERFNLFLNILITLRFLTLFASVGNKKCSALFDARRNHEKNVEIIIHISLALYHLQGIQGSSVTSHALCVLHDRSLKVFYTNVIS